LKVVISRTGLRAAMVSAILIPSADGGPVTETSVAPPLSS